MYLIYSNVIQSVCRLIRKAADVKLCQNAENGIVHSVAVFYLDFRNINEFLAKIIQIQKQ